MNVVLVLIYVVAGFVGGSLVTFVALVRWWNERLKDPEVALAILKKCYRDTHPHWCQVSKDDKTPVCPCCGWSETESVAGHRHVDSFAESE